MPTVAATVIGKCKDVLRHVNDNIHTEFQDKERESILAFACNLRFLNKDIDASGARALIHRSLTKLIKQERSSTKTH